MGQCNMQVIDGAHEDWFSVEDLGGFLVLGGGFGGGGGGGGGGGTGGQMGVGRWGFVVRVVGVEGGREEG